MQVERLRAMQIPCPIRGFSDSFLREMHRSDHQEGSAVAFVRAMQIVVLGSARTCRTSARDADPGPGAALGPVRMRVPRARRRSGPWSCPGARPHAGSPRETQIRGHGPQLRTSGGSKSSKASRPLGGCRDAACAPTATSQSGSHPGVRAWPRPRLWSCLRDAAVGADAEGHEDGQDDGDPSEGGEHHRPVRVSVHEAADRVDRDGHGVGVGDRLQPRGHR